jgi:hypothetical protein
MSAFPKTCYLIILILIPTCLFAQDGKKNRKNKKRVSFTSPTIPYAIDYKTVVFSTPDTTYLITQYNYPYGAYEFRPGPADLERIKDSSLHCSVDGKNHLQTFNFLMNVDTLYSHLPGRATEKTEIIKNQVYTQYELADAAKFSYILSRINLGMIDAVSDSIVIRIAEPTRGSVNDLLIGPENMSSGILYIMNEMQDYDIYELRMKDDGGKLYYYSIKSMDKNGLKLVKTETIDVSKKQCRKIGKQLSEMDFSGDISCVAPGYKYYAECNYNNKYNWYTIADYSSRYHKECGPYFGLCWSIRGIYILHTRK